jgi:hypothetical protein
MPKKKSTRKGARKPARTKPAPIQPSRPISSEPAELVATTIGEAAVLLDISTRVLATWATQPGFPGKPGSPGKRDGHFPIEKIRTWHLATHGPSWRRGGNEDEEAAAARRLKLLIECDQAQVELERDLGTIGDTEAMALFCRRVVNAAKSQLEEAADRTLSRLPGKIDAATRKIIRKAIEQTVSEALNTIAELVAGDADDDEDLADEDE